MPDIAIIVALHRLTRQAHQCIETIVSLDDPRIELIVACDRRPDGLPPAIQVVETGSTVDTSPAEKRDAALVHVDAPICAFIDDDAYPAPDWIHRALARFTADPTLHALGGPGITPPNSPLRHRLAGAFYESRLGSGGLRHRFVPQPPRRDIDDWPAYNFFVRTDALRAVGGWNSQYYGGEDTKLCLALKRAGYRIAYDPDVLVYHHRRPVFVSLMRQTANVGRRRGSFVRQYPDTSRRLIYFMPAAALVVTPFLLTVAARSSRYRRRIVQAAAAGWCASAALASRDGTSLDEAVLLPAVLGAGHGAYGWGFLNGLVEKGVQTQVDVFAD